MYESLESTLIEHLRLCEETYQILLEENRMLKQSGQRPSNDFLNQKQSLLLRFEVTNRTLAEASRQEARRFRATIEKAQRLVLKTLLLDRENEQLLLKCALGEKPRVKWSLPPPTQVTRTYRDNYSSEKNTTLRAV
jgi:hypothetical protein